MQLTSRGANDTFPKAVAMYGKATITYIERLVLREQDQRASKIQMFNFQKINILRYKEFYIFFLPKIDTKLNDKIERNITMFPKLE